MERSQLGSVPGLARGYSGSSRLAMRAMGTLALGLAVLTAWSCNGKSDGACPTFCADLCDALTGCDVGEIAPSCAADCAAGLGSADCSAARPPGQLTCNELSEVYACSEYCVAFCTRAAECAPFDEQLCVTGCVADPVICNPKSVAPRSCDQLKPEARRYEDSARAMAAGDEVFHFGGTSPAFGLCDNPTDCEVPLGCSAETNTCGPCSGDAECGQSYSLASYRCTAARECVEVECLTDAECFSGFCDAETNTCGECRVDADCGSFLSVCKDSECVQCTQDEHCDGGFGSKCDLAANSCVECLSNADCATDDSPHCNDAQYCTSCVSDADCVGRAGPFCGAFECVECTANAQCTDPALPFCDSFSGTCSSIGI